MPERFAGRKTAVLVPKSGHVRSSNVNNRSPIRLVSACSPLIIARGLPVAIFVIAAKAARRVNRLRSSAQAMSGESFSIHSLPRELLTCR